MDEAQKEELITLIRAEIEKLSHEAGVLEESVKPVAPDRAIGRLTRMEAINAKNMSEANLRNARQRIKKLEDALKRVDDEEFGICVRCERDIPIKRLMLMPESRVCVRCLSR